MSFLRKIAYSAIVNGKTVYAGYAGEAHAWNLLQLDGEYYNMDVTWDYPIGNPATTYYHDYFNVTDQQLSRDHTRDAISAQLPVAYGTRYSFGSYFGDFSDNDYCYDYECNDAYDYYGYNDYYD